eukprot:TRINITY_DN24816_c0_g1_i3.p1 TRINITY_DN24816_c0_g1~~TRINITY_DN24816_c0_g1_i3.p1  ORF type:complete len:920 (+),score=151.13 TRINITY_DN24816_c0_g1_i3:72-2831(+)
MPQRPRVHPPLRAAAQLLSPPPRPSGGSRLPKWEFPMAPPLPRPLPPQAQRWEHATGATPGSASRPPPPPPPRHSASPPPLKIPRRRTHAPKPPPSALHPKAGKAPPTPPPPSAAPLPKARKVPPPPPPPSAPGPKATRIPPPPPPPSAPGAKFSKVPPPPPPMPPGRGGHGPPLAAEAGAAPAATGPASRSAPGGRRPRPSPPSDPVNGLRLPTPADATPPPKKPRLEPASATEVAVAAAAKRARLAAASRESGQPAAAPSADEAGPTRSGSPELLDVPASPLNASLSDEFPDADKVAPEGDEMREAGTEPEGKERASPPATAPTAAGVPPTAAAPEAAPAPDRQREPAHAPDPDPPAELRQGTDGVWCNFETFRMTRPELTPEEIRLRWECHPLPAPRSAREPPCRCLPAPLHGLVTEAVKRWSARLDVFGQAAVDALLALDIPEAQRVLRQLARDKLPGAAAEESVTARCVELARRAPGYEPPERRTVCIFDLVTIPEELVGVRGDRPDLSELAWAYVTPALVGLTVHCGPVLRFALSQVCGQWSGTFEFATTDGCARALAATTICGRDVTVRRAGALQRGLTLAPKTREWLDAHRGGPAAPPAKLRARPRAPAIAWQHHNRQLELCKQRRRPAPGSASLPRTPVQPPPPPPPHPPAQSAAGRRPEPRRGAGQGGAAPAAAARPPARGAFDHSPLWGSLSASDSAIFAGRGCGELALAVLRHLADTAQGPDSGTVGEHMHVVDADGNLSLRAEAPWELLRFGCHVRGGFWKTDNRLEAAIPGRDCFDLLHWAAGAEPPDPSAEQGGAEGECSAARIREALSAGAQLLRLGGRVTVTVHDKVPHRQWQSLSGAGLEYVAQEPVTAAKFPSLVAPGGIFPCGATTYVFAKTAPCAVDAPAASAAERERCADSDEEIIL